MTDTEENIRLHSGEYVKMYERKPLSRLARLIPTMSLGGGETLADFACGNAMLLPLVHDRVKHYHGVDFSADFIRAAQDRADTLQIENCSFHCMDILEFCRTHAGGIDVATAMDFSEHINDQDFVEIFTAIHASLKSGGRLYLHTPNLTFFLELFKQHGIVPQFPQHIAVRDTRQNLELLEKCGFGVSGMTCHELPHYNILKVLHPLRRIPFIGKYFVARLFIECRK